MSTPTSKSPWQPNLDIEPEILDALNGLPDDFDGFAEVFQNELRPELQKREVDRLKAANNARRMTILGVIVGVVGAAVSLSLLRVPQLAVLSGIVGAGVFSAGRVPLRRISRQAKTLLIEPLADQFKLRFTPDPGAQSSVMALRRARLLPQWDRSNYQDRLEGTRNGVNFEFFEAHLEERRTTRDSNGSTRTRWVTVFRGQCLRFEFHKDFMGRTVALRDAGLFNRFGGGRGLSRAKLESPKFEKAFEVYTTDQVEARYLLTPDLMQRLIELEDVFRGGDLRFAFVDGEMLVALEGGDLFEPGSLFTPLDNPSRIRELLDDFASVFRLIDSFADPEVKRRGDRAQ